MFAISDSQLDALDDKVRQNFRIEMVELLNSKFPDSEIDDSVRWVEVDDSCDEAKALGLASRGDVRSWIMLRAVHGPNLADLDWVKPVLEDSLLTAGERLSVIDERAMTIEARLIGANS